MGAAGWPPPCFPFFCHHSSRGYHIALSASADKPYNCQILANRRTMDLRTLADRTQLAQRRIRDVLDRRLIPGDWQPAGSEVGRPRRFNNEVGLLVAIAAHLVEAGLKTTVVKGILGEIPKVKLPRKRKASLLQAVLQYEVPAMIDIGDGSFVRFRVGDWDSGWKKPGSRVKVPRDYQPYVAIQIDVERIRRDVLPEPAEEQQR